MSRQTDPQTANLDGWMPIISIVASLSASGLFIYGYYHAWPLFLIAAPIFVAGQINGAMIWKRQ